MKLINLNNKRREFMIIAILSKLKRIIRNSLFDRRQKKRIRNYIQNGRIPWSEGYNEYKIATHKKIIYKDDFILDSGFGVGLDERIVEYPWILSRLEKKPMELLDAGSTLNHDYILTHPIITKKKVTICTYYPEEPSFTRYRINYVYEDLRKLPFLGNYFDEIVCISTLEHIDMNNSLYGYDIPNTANSEVKSYEYLKVVAELDRVLKKGGTLLVTVPFGKYESHGFFQQFDSEMIDRIKALLEPNGTIEFSYFKYLSTGWIISNQKECKNEESYNPHTGVGKKDDGAAHSRAICCLEFTKAK